MKLTRIFIYPIKSLGEVELSEAKIDQFGLQYDRRWMIVDTNGEAITQRQSPELSQFIVKIKRDSIIVTHKNDSTFNTSLPLTLSKGDTISVKIWDDICIAIKADESINYQFSKVIGKLVILVYLPEENGRIINTQYTNNKEVTSFTDGFPILILGESSLELLNSKLEDKITIDRFRPNLVFSGGLPNCEDYFTNFTIGKSEFNGVKPCSRCVVTTINPETAKKGIEPLKTLNSYRLINNKVLFGMNVLVVNGKDIRVGDKLTLI